MSFLSFYSVWPFFACLALLVALAATPLFRAADTPAGVQTNRIHAMDGMRGFLALAVVFHHAAVYHRFLLDGTWTAPPSSFFTLLGPFGVGVFFMITGFLFWSQMIRKRGRLLWKALYVGRLFRIGPLYLAAVAAMVAIVAARTGWLHQSLPATVFQAVRLGSLGLFNVPAAINGYREPTLLLAGVTWSLQWEWFFYLSLPLLAPFARRRGMHLWFVLSAIAACQIDLHLLPHRSAAAGERLAYVMLFLLGMLAASLREEGRLIKVPDSVGSVVLAAILVFIFQFQSPTGTLAPQAALGLLLYLVLSGSSLFGLLTTRAAIRLGDVSYGIYLLQGLVLAGVLRPNFSRALDLRSPLGHWLLCLLASILLILLATATHVWIERPGILAGRRLMDRLKPGT